MSKPFDATLKAILEASPTNWPRLAGLRVGQAEVIDSDISTVTAATDKVIRILGDHPYLLPIDFQGSPDSSLPDRVLVYNVLLRYRHKIPVQSVVVLLRPEANLRTITGLHEISHPGEVEPYLTFRYKVIRVWKIPAEELLNIGPSTWPLAPIGAVTTEELPGVIQRLKKKLEAPEYENLAGQLWTATDILMGLRYQPALVEQLLRGEKGMKESVTYQAIVEEGRVEEARRLLLLQGEISFGEMPSTVIQNQIDAISNLEYLEHLAERLVQVHSWEELLANQTTTQRRRGRKKKE